MFTKPQLMIDTGVSLIQLPEFQYQQVLQYLNNLDFTKCGKNFYGHTYHCTCNGPEDLEKFPTMTFTMNGRDFHLKPKDYILYRRGGCDVTIRKTHGMMPFGILGMGFLRGHQVLYDMDNKRVGIAPAKESFNNLKEQELTVKEDTEMDGDYQ